MFKLAITLLALALSVVALPAEIVNIPRDTAAVTASGFNITSIGVNGSGCPAGTASYALSADKSSLDVTFSNFYARAGPGVAISENRKNCQVTLGVRVPSGVSFSVDTVGYSGYYALDAKVTSTQKAIFYFQGELDQATATSTRTGPISGGNYQFRDGFPLGTVQSDCGASTVLNINSSLRVSNSANTGGSGFIANIVQTIGLGWSTCRS